MKNKKANIGKEIIRVLSEGGNVKMNYKQIAAKVGIFDKKGREKVKNIINDFVEAHIILTAGRGKYKLSPKHYTLKTTGHNYIVGKLSVRQNGMAFVIREDGEADDIFVADSNLQNALHGDMVKVLLFPSRRDKRPEGQVVEIIKRNQYPIVGVIKHNNGINFFIPDNPSYRKNIIIPARFLSTAQEGEKVVVTIVDWATSNKNPVGKVIEVLGTPGEHDVEMNAILVEYNFPLHFSEKVEKEAAALKTTINDEEIKKRRDFRSVTTFTIDPADAKDFDDAISYEKLENERVRIGIHIADVSFFVKKGSPIDQEAYERGTSVYLVDRTIPMFPETLANNLCSLRPHEDKLCYSAVFDLDEEGKVHHEWYGRTVIHSDRQFSYEEVQQIIEEKKGDLVDIILPIHHIAQKLRQKRIENHAINFETKEVKFVLDDEGKPIDVVIKESKEANFLIEELMLLANKKVAEKIGKVTQKEKEVKTFVYRVHDEPITDKLEQFKLFSHKLGYEIKTTSRRALVSSFNHLFEETKSSGEYDMMSHLIVRLMARAVYSTNNIGHYGLAFPYYTHFTSPIRRYPDLMVHRLFDAYLKNKQSVNKEEYENYCKHASQMEQKATEAERNSIKYKQAEYLADKIGQEFEALVTGIAKWGLFAEIKESKCEGLIPMRKLDDDFYYIDEENYTLVGLHKGNTIRIGDTITIKVVEVDILKKQMNFELVKL